MRSRASQSSSRTSKQKISSNLVEDTVLNTNEKILRECSIIYEDEDRGLIKLGEELAIALLPPRKKVIVMIMGNHSAGKSSFVNWYVEEHVQRTGVALETQGITFITSGKKRDSLTGNATLHLYPHFRQLESIRGVFENLGTEVVASRAKRFSLVTFVDTPGLVDGDMKYPFNVLETLIWLGGLADLSFVFFDPMGQALCKKTLDIVEKLSQTHAEKVRFYLAKADTAGSQTDRQRVLMQITQAICKRPGLNRVGFDLPTVYIPSLADNPKCENQLSLVEREIDKAIDTMVQGSLNALERDTNKIAAAIDDRLRGNTIQKSLNRKARLQCLLLLLLGMLGPLLFLGFILHTLLPKDTPVNWAWVGGKESSSSPILNLLLHNWGSAWTMLGLGLNPWSIAAVGIASLLCCLAGLLKRTGSTLPKRTVRSLQEKTQYLRTTVIKKKEELYKDYLSEAVNLS